MSLSTTPFVDRPGQGNKENGLPAQVITVNYDSGTVNKQKKFNQMRPGSNQVNMGTARAPQRFDQKFETVYPFMPAGAAWGVEQFGWCLAKKAHLRAGSIPRGMTLGAEELSNTGLSVFETLNGLPYVKQKPQADSQYPDGKWDIIRQLVPIGISAQNVPDDSQKRTFSVQIGGYSQCVSPYAFPGKTDIFLRLPHEDECGPNNRATMIPVPFDENIAKSAVMMLAANDDTALEQLVNDGKLTREALEDMQMIISYLPYEIRREIKEISSFSVEDQAYATVEALTKAMAFFKIWVVGTSVTSCRAGDLLLFQHKK